MGRARHLLLQLGEPLSAAHPLHLHCLGGVAKTFCCKLLLV